MLIDFLICYCIDRDIVTADEIPILRYCLEKKIHTIAITIPVLALSMYLSDPITGITFLGTFYFMRSVTNGYHAKTATRCLFGSIGIVYGMFSGISPLLNLQNSVIVLVASIFVIWKMAPYNHPNMDYSNDDISICQKCAKVHVCIVIVLIIIISINYGFHDTIGFILGLFLDAILLGVGYLMGYRRINNG